MDCSHNEQLNFCNHQDFYLFCIAVLIPRILNEVYMLEFLPEPVECAGRPSRWLGENGRVSLPALGRFLGFGRSKALWEAARKKAGESNK